MTPATILVVDDSKSLLKVISGILRDAGFTVLTAQNGLEAIEVSKAYPGTIDLLLSDIRMPAMRGPDLGIAIKEFRPDLLVMLMSGYPGGDLLVLNYGWNFIQTPLVPQKLVEMVNKVLNTPDRSQGGFGFEAP